MPNHISAFDAKEYDVKIKQTLPYYDEFYQQVIDIKDTRKILKDIASKKPDTQCAKSTISFTYGDSHPAFSPKVNDGKEYRKKLYTYDEISGIIEKYGYPQDWNNDEKHGPERYIEAHIWSDDVIKEQENFMTQLPYQKYITGENFAARKQCLDFKRMELECEKYNEKLRIFKTERGSSK